MNDRRLARWIFLALLALYLGTARGHFIGTDEIGLFRQARSLLTQGTLEVGPINNSFLGRGGRYDSQYPIGQSLLALPLVALGLAADRLPEGALRRALAGPQLGSDPSRWGGDPDIFVACLFNALVCAAIGALHFLFGRKLGAPPWAAATAALLTGTTTQLWLHATMFLSHPLEALLLLGALYLLEEERFLAAGAACGFLLNVRVAAGIALVPLALVLLARRRGLVQFALGVAPFALLYALVGFWKFGVFPPPYNNEGFNTPLLEGLYGLLVSPGMGVLVYSPLVLLAPLWLRKHRAMAGVVFFWLLLHAKYSAWHGLWSAFGPRYLLAVTPLVLLPLGPWLAEAPRRLWAIAPLALAGLCMQVLGVSLNWAFIYHASHWPEDKLRAFLFVPSISPPAVFARMLARGENLDLWALWAWRASGPLFALALVLPALALLGVSAFRIRALLRDSR